MLNKDGGAAGSAARRKSKLVKIAAGVAVLVLVALILTLSLVFTVGKKSKDANADSQSASAANGGSQPTGTSNGNSGTSAPLATTGVTGSVITMENGTTFTYTNEFGGDWVFDPTDPLTGGGKAQSWSPRIGEEWRWGEETIRGVNLGGWLVTEPFICPGLYEPWLQNAAGITVVDEYTLSQAMGDRLAEVMEEHYRTFITEKDIADIAAAGLNWIRIPIGFWAIETWEGEPYLEGVSWTYFLKALGWARKYGLRVFMDVHALPGSQNGWDHSGKHGSINVMHGVMGIANAQRSLTYLRIFTQFISQPQYKDLVLIFGIVNEVRHQIGDDSIRSFYSAAYETIREVTGIGAGNGPYIAIHNAFRTLDQWEGFLTGADRVILDQHPYLAFQGDTSPTPASSVRRPCSNWAAGFNRSQSVFGITVGGELSTAVNSCGVWLDGIGTEQPERCIPYNNWADWDQAWIDSLLQISLATMDAAQNFFYWTWRIGDSTVLGTSSSPMWNYKLGRERGWIPKDPRDAVGHCAREIGPTPFDGVFPATATGGAGAGVGVATLAFPPATILPSAVGPAAVSLLPTYTPTGTLVTLAAPTFTAAPNVDVGTGWSNQADSELAYVPVSGCVYPDSYSAQDLPVPVAPFCGA